jgi:hypothetical protein
LICGHIGDADGGLLLMCTEAGIAGRMRLRIIRAGALLVFFRTPAPIELLHQFHATLCRTSDPDRVLSVAFL